MFDIEAHNPAVGRGSLLFHREGLSCAEAIALMERHLDKSFVLRERGPLTVKDHDALRRFQMSKGKVLSRL